jgi:hypothetical protein
MGGQLKRRRIRTPEFGDIVVIRVARHYNIGREAARPEPITAIAVKNCLDDALEIAHRFVTGCQRVFLYDHPDSAEHVEIDAGHLNRGDGPGTAGDPRAGSENLQNSTDMGRMTR